MNGGEEPAEDIQVKWVQIQFIKDVINVIKVDTIQKSCAQGETGTENDETEVEGTYFNRQGDLCLHLSIDVRVIL